MSVCWPTKMIYDQSFQIDRTSYRSRSHSRCHITRTQFSRNGGKCEHIAFIYVCFAHLWLFVRLCSREWAAKKTVFSHLSASTRTYRAGYCVCYTVAMTIINSSHTHTHTMKHSLAWYGRRKHDTDNFDECVRPIFPYLWAPMSTLDGIYFLHIHEKSVTNFWTLLLLTAAPCQPSPRLFVSIYCIPLHPIYSVQFHFGRVNIWFEI